MPTAYQTERGRKERQNQVSLLRRLLTPASSHKKIPGPACMPQTSFFELCHSKVYRVRQENSNSALGSTSQCSRVLPSNPFPVGHSVADFGKSIVPSRIVGLERNSFLNSGTIKMALGILKGFEVKGLKATGIH